MGRLLNRVTAEGPVGGEEDTASFSTLTSREWSILELASEGCTNKQIGVRLNISPYTVAQHIAKMLRRTGAANRTDLVNRAHRAGVLPLNIKVPLYITYIASL